MSIQAHNCPICGELIVWDNVAPNPDIYIITTKRRSTVLVHKRCYQNNLTRKETKNNEHKER